jgi:uncharacterized protein
MNFPEQINTDMKSALKEGRKLELETLRTIRAAILEFEKKKVGAVMSEDDEIAILSAAVKKRREAIEQYRNAGRDDLADQETAEMHIIARYLPAQLTEDDIRTAVRDMIAQTGATGLKDLGKVMGPVMKALKGRADGTMVQAIVKEMLGAA